MSNYKAPMAVHPGETLREVLETYNMSREKLAIRTRLHPVAIDDILSGKDPISPEIARSLSLVFLMSEDFWNNLQKNYEERRENVL